MKTDPELDSFYGSMEKAVDAAIPAHWDGDYRKRAQSAFSVLALDYEFAVEVDTGKLRFYKVGKKTIWAICICVSKQLGNCPIYERIV